MSTLSRSSTFSSPPASSRGCSIWQPGCWRASLNMPEPLVHDTGVFVFAQVQAVENSVGKTLCPIRLLRQLRNWRRRSAR